MGFIPKAVLLDLDGTIVHFAFDARRARSKIVEMLIEGGFSQELYKPEYRISEIFNEFEEYLNSNSSEEDREWLMTFKRRMSDLVEIYEMEGAEKAVLIEGVVEALKELKRMGISLVIVTNNSSKPTFLTLRKVGLDSFFDTIVTREENGFMKPHSQPIERVMKMLDFKPEEALFVGDSHTDMKAAKTAGITAIGVTTGTSDEETLKASGASNVILSLSQLPAMIREGKISTMNY
ncbi:MAG: phosphoglycolate phosphatase [Thermoproteota archaeon]|nr:phosphoglycolate phosphatase [Thermoproteota archaeon]